LACGFSFIFFSFPISFIYLFKKKTNTPMDGMPMDGMSCLIGIHFS
jgi:hypothetical protein